MVVHREPHHANGDMHGAIQNIVYRQDLTSKLLVISLYVIYPIICFEGIESL